MQAKKICIIGAGPVGCYSAFLLAKRGYSVSIYEKNKEIGVPMQCTGIMTQSIYNIVDIPDNIVLNRTNFVSVNSQNHEIKIPNNDIIIDRVKFDKHFAKIAEENGVKIHHGHLFKKIEANNIIVYNQKLQREEKVPFDILIGADGPNSRVSGYINKSKSINYVGIQARIKDSPVIEANVFKTYFGDVCPDFFAWIVPESSNVARVGLASIQNPNSLLDEFLKKRVKKCTIIDRQGGLIPLYSGKKVIQKKNIYLVGDSADMVKATTGGGIVQGFIGAKLLVRSIHENISYQKLFSKKLKRDLQISLYVRKILNTFDNKEYDELFEKLNTEKVKNILFNTSRDYPIKLLTQLFFAKPSLVKYSKKIISLI